MIFSCLLSEWRFLVCVCVGVWGVNNGVLALDRHACPVIEFAMDVH